MHMDPIMPMLTIGALVVVSTALGLKLLKQPTIIAYMIAGVILGPSVLGVVSDQTILARLGEIGVLLLLFFIGSEISLPRLIANWRVALVGTVLQIVLSVGCLWGIGEWFQWPLNRIILLGFVISLSSTAVVLRVLQDRNEIETEEGQDVIGILLVQDLAIIPMLIIINFLGGTAFSISQVILQIIGGVAIISLFIWIIVKQKFTIPFAKLVRQEHELQVFAAFFLCFGFASLTGLFGLSTALGAFIAGICIATAHETQWVHSSLNAFHIVFVSIFFVSIGMLVKIDFVIPQWKAILLISFGVIFINTLINTFTLKIWGNSWKRSIYTGSILSQIGEFSFILVAVGLQTSIISDFSYQLVVSVIITTLVLTPFWVGLTKLLTGAPPGVNITDQLKGTIGKAVPDQLKNIPDQLKDTIEKTVPDQLKNIPDQLKDTIEKTQKTIRETTTKKH